MRFKPGFEPKPAIAKPKDDLGLQHFKMIRNRSVNSLIVHLKRKENAPEIKFGSKQMSTGDLNASYSRPNFNPDLAGTKQPLLLMQELDEIFFPIRGVGVPSNRVSSRLPVKPAPPPPSYPLIERMRAKYDNVSFKATRPERTLPISCLPSELSAQLFSPHQKPEQQNLASTSNTPFLIRRHSTPHISHSATTSKPQLSNLQTSDSNHHLAIPENHNNMSKAAPNYLNLQPNLEKRTEVRFQPISGFSAMQATYLDPQSQQSEINEQNWTTKTMLTAKHKPASKLPKKFRMLMASIKNAESRHLDLIKSSAQDAGIYDEASTVEIFLYRESKGAHESEIISRNSSLPDHNRANMLNLSVARGLQDQKQFKVQEFKSSNDSAYNNMAGPSK